MRAPGGSLLKMSRRNLLLGGLGLAGLGLGANQSHILFGSSLSNQDNGLDLWGSICSLPKNSSAGDANGYDAAVSGFIPRVLFFKGQDVWSLDLPLQGHVVQQNPYHPEQMIILNRRGPSGVELHFGQRKIKSVFTAGEGRVFLGHCLFLPDGETYALAEFRRADRNNFLVHRRISDHKIVRELPIEQMLPHQLLIDPVSKHIWVPSMGSAVENQRVSTSEKQDFSLPHICLRDLETNRLEDVIFFQRTGSVGPKHLANMQELGLIALGGSIDSHSFVARIWRDKKGLRQLGGHQPLPGEALSLAFSSDQVVYASFPSANRVVAFDGSSMKVLRELKIPSPMGMHRMQNGEIWVASEGYPHNISVIRNLEVIGSVNLGLRANERFGAHFEFLESV